MSDTASRPAPIHLDDLADPQFSPEIDEMLAAVGPMGAAVELNADALMTQAATELGLDDFGPMDFVPRLELLLQCLDTEAPLSPLGRLSAAGLCTGLLRNRLLLADLLTRHPEIHDIEIERPIIIAGLPRTGTTHLHNLISSDPALRSLPYWESMEPIPVPAEAALVGYGTTHERDRFGKVIYDVEQLGIDVGARREQMRAYSEFFDIPDEPW